MADNRVQRNFARYNLPLEEGFLERYAARLSLCMQETLLRDSPNFPV